MRRTGWILFLFTGLMGAWVNAQTIEVIVEETVELKPVDYVYLVKLEDDWESLEYALQELENTEEEYENSYEEQENTRLKELEMTLEQQKFSFERVENQSLIDYGNNEALLVKLPNEAELKRLEKLLETFEDVEGFVESANFEDKSVHYASAYARLLEKAKQEAAVLAKISGKTLGVVLAIQELPEQFDLFDSLLNDTMNSPSKKRMMREFGFDPLVEKAEFTFMFRFELK